MAAARYLRTIGWLSVLAAAHLIAHLAGMRVGGHTEALIGFPTAATLMMLGLLLVGLQTHPRADPQRAGSVAGGGVVGRVAPAATAWSEVGSPTTIVEGDSARTRVRSTRGRHHGSHLESRSRTSHRA